MRWTHSRADSSFKTRLTRHIRRDRPAPAYRTTKITGEVYRLILRGRPQHSRQPAAIPLWVAQTIPRRLLIRDKAGWDAWFRTTLSSLFDWRDATMIRATGLLSLNRVPSALIAALLFVAISLAEQRGSPNKAAGLASMPSFPPPPPYGGRTGHGGRPDADAGHRS